MAFIFGMHTDIFQLSPTRFHVFYILGKLKAMTKEREWDNEVKRNRDPQTWNSFTSNKPDRYIKTINWVITSCHLLTLDARKTMCAKDLLPLVPEWTVVFSAKSKYPWKINLCLKEPVCSCMMTVHLSSAYSSSVGQKKSYIKGTSMKYEILIKPTSKKTFDTSRSKDRFFSTDIWIG